MSRPLRIEYPGALYHITSRGNARQKIFLNRKDFTEFLSVLKNVIERYGWIVYAYCLMPNHYHLVIETPTADLSQGMRQLNGVYTQKFNYYHKKTGHVFQGRFKAIIVEKEAYLYRLISYVVLNPVKAGLAKTPENWPWSSHQEMLKYDKKKAVIARGKAISIFGNINNYRKFLRQQDVDVLSEVKSGFILGSDEFICQIKERIGQDRQGNRGFARRERFLGRPKLEQLFAGKKPSKAQRNQLIHDACFKHAYSLTEIASATKLSISAVSLVVNKRMDKIKTQK